MKQPKGDLLMRIGASVLTLGMLLTIIAISPLVTGFELDSIWWLLSMLAGLGLGLILLGLRRSSKTRSSL